MVGPKVAAAAAQRALEVLAEEDPAVAAEAAALQEGEANGQAQDGKKAERSAAPGQDLDHAEQAHLCSASWSAFVQLSS